MSGPLMASYIALWLLFLMIAIAVLLLYRHFGVIAMGGYRGIQRDGLPEGEPAPGISGVTAGGLEFRWEPPPRASTLLLFAAPDCAPCAEIMPFFAALDRNVPKDELEIMVVVAGPQMIAERLANKFDVGFTCIAEDASGAFQNYRVRATPFAFMIDTSGRVSSKGLCSEPAFLRDMLLDADLIGAGTLVEEQRDRRLPVVSPSAG